MRPDNRPNILFVMADQHSAAVSGCYGHPIVRTPGIDRLAATGTRFTNAFCASPLCGPSRVSWITGTHPHTHGAITHNNRRHRSGRAYQAFISPGVRSLVVDFRDAGYATFGAGFLHVDHHVPGQNPYRTLGFDAWECDAQAYGRAVGEDVQQRYNRANIISEMWEHSYRNVEGEPFPYPEDTMWDSMITDATLGFLERRDADRPFFAYVGYRAPHPPWCAPERFHSLYDPDAIGELPNYRVHYTDKPRRVIERVNYYELWNLPEEMVRRSIAAYYGFVSYLDSCVGRLIDALEARGLREDTVVVYTSDHGEMLYRNGICEKHTFFEDAVRIPFIVSHPGSVPQAGVSDALVSNVDFLPTLLRHSGLDVPTFVEGRDLAPTFAGEEVRSCVFAEYYHSLDPSRMVREKRFKYIHTEEDICELYDLEHDPDESINLAWYPQYADRVARMDTIALADWEIPEVPIWATWNDLNERKQRLRLSNPGIIDPRPSPPQWMADYSGE